MNTILPENEVTEFEDRVKEVWKDIPGWEGLYQASTLGRIRRLPMDLVYSDGQRHHYPKKVYSPAVSGNGYKTVTFRRPGGEQQFFYVHRLVAETFLEKPGGCDTVNHLDADRTNNRVSNLEWTTDSGNAVHAMLHYGEIGAIKMRPVVCLETGEVFASSSEAARSLRDRTSNVKSSAANIWAVASGQRHKALGVHWKFKEDI